MKNSKYFLLILTFLLLASCSRQYRSIGASGSIPPPTAAVAMNAEQPAIQTKVHKEEPKPQTTSPEGETKKHRKPAIRELKNQIRSYQDISYSDIPHIRAAVRNAAGKIAAVKTGNTGRKDKKRDSSWLLLLYFLLIFEIIAVVMGLILQSNGKKPNWTQLLLYPVLVFVLVLLCMSGM